MKYRLFLPLDWRALVALLHLPSFAYKLFLISKSKLIQSVINMASRSRNNSNLPSLSEEALNRIYTNKFSLTSFPWQGKIDNFLSSTRASFLWQVFLDKENLTIFYHLHEQVFLDKEKLAMFLSSTRASLSCQGKFARVNAALGLRQTSN